MNETIRAADAVARRLYEAGCRYAFGMPGGEVLTIVDALEKAGIRFVLCKHENNAGFIGEGVMHRTGAPAILVGTVGPGLVNGTNVIANAHQDRVPLIVLTGCVDASEALTYTHQVFDHEAVFSSITKATFRLTADGADIIADKAVAIATEPRQGPVLIDVPISVADAPVDLSTIRRRAVASPVAAAPGPDLDKARQWLQDAERPVMIAGLDVLAEGSADQVRKFCETLNVPLITSYKAKGVLPEDHPLALGGAGLSPLADKSLLPFIGNSDLIICAGYDPIEMRTGWREAWDPTAVNVIDISAVPNTHYMHQSTISFVGHTGSTLDRLLEGQAGGATWGGNEVAALREELATAFPRDDAWGPGAVIDECQKVLPEDVLATVDSGAHRILLSQMWQCREPRQLIQSTALCTMGCALPMAIGQQFASPERQVVSFSGDAGFLMVAGELSTAKELDVKPIFVVFVDASLALIELKQRGRQMAKNGVLFGKHDYASIGEAFGGYGHTVTNRDELRQALKAGLDADSFTVIAAHIDEQSYIGRI